MYLDVNMTSHLTSQVSPRNVTWIQDTEVADTENQQNYSKLLKIEYFQPIGRWPRLK